MPKPTPKPSKNNRFGIYDLDVFWMQYYNIKINKQVIEELDWQQVNAFCNTLGIGLEPTFQYIYNHSQNISDFEDWIERNGNYSNDRIAQYNKVVVQDFVEEQGNFVEVFSQEELENFDREGYIILRNAIPKEDAAETVRLIYDVIEADPSNPESWYKAHPLKQGVMVQLFNAPILEKNRMSERIKLAYEQLWERKDLLVSMDRVGFNPPTSKLHPYKGQGLHWDVSLKRPIPFGLQGILYLTDTAANQGAFTLIPGFHKKIDTWLDNLPEGANPRDKTLISKLETKAIAAQAGDLIIWRQSIAHGGSPNTADRPRVVQYINYQPINMEVQKEWI